MSLMRTKAVFEFEYIIVYYEYISQTKVFLSVTNKTQWVMHFWT